MKTGGIGGKGQSPWLRYCWVVRSLWCVHSCPSGGSSSSIWSSTPPACWLVLSSCDVTTTRWPTQDARCQISYQLLYCRQLIPATIKEQYAPQNHSQHVKNDLYKLLLIICVYFCTYLRRNHNFGSRNHIFLLSYQKSWFVLDVNPINWHYATIFITVVL